MERRSSNPGNTKTNGYRRRSRIAAATMAVAGALPVVAGCGEVIAGQAQPIALQETPTPTPTTATGNFGKPPQLLNPSLCSPMDVYLYQQSIKNVLPRDIECITGQAANTMGSAELKIAESATTSSDETLAHLNDMVVTVKRNGPDTAASPSDYSRLLQVMGAKDETIISPTGTLYNHCFETEILPGAGDEGGSTSYYMGCIVGRATIDQDAVVSITGWSAIPNDAEAAADVRSVMFMLAEEGFDNVSR